MKILKPILIIALILLVGFVLFLYNGFNGNPVTKFFSKIAVENYVEETYPNQDFHIEDGFYNFKVSGYEFIVREIGATDSSGNVKEYNFITEGFIFPKVSSDGIYEANLDRKMATRFNNEINEELSPILEKEVPSVRDIEFYIEVLKGTFPDDVAWSKDLELEKPMHVFVQLDASKQSEEDFLAEVEAFRDVLDTEGYTYESIMFNGNIFEMEDTKDSYTGYLKYSIRVYKGEEIKKKDLEKHNEDMMN